MSKSRGSKGLSARQKKALTALMVYPTIVAAIEACGICEKTMFNYLKDPGFKAELGRRQEQVLTATVASLVELSGKAAKVLDGLVSDLTGNVTNSVRLRAAVAILDRAGMGEVADKSGSLVLASYLEELTQIAQGETDGK